MGPSSPWLLGGVAAGGTVSATWRGASTHPSNGTVTSNLFGFGPGTVVLAPTGVAGTAAAFGRVAVVTVGSISNCRSLGEIGQVPAGGSGTGQRTASRSIQPGTYRIRYRESTCHRERASGFGGSVDETIAGDPGRGHAVMTVAAGGAGFGSDRCGTWSSDRSVVIAGPTSDDGTHIVGADVRPGPYRSTATSCSGERLTGFGGTGRGTIAAGQVTGLAVVDITAGDLGCTPRGCGGWNVVRQSPRSLDLASRVARFRRASTDPRRR